MNKRFIIGQFEAFDLQKHKREYRDGFKGLEVCQFASEDEIVELDEFVVSNDLTYGVHFPLRKGIWKYRDPQYLSKDEMRLQESFDFLKSEFEYISQTEAKYILIHYPKPVILDREVDWDSTWRFADDTEYYFEDDYEFNEFKRRSYEFFDWLNRASEEYGLDVYVELDALNEYLYDTDLLDELLSQFDNVDLCLDIGRLHLQHMIDDEFDAFKFIRRIGKHVKHIHLWNVKVSNNVEGGHFPSLPSLSVEEGWADCSATVKL